jgi:outer membrane protein assembly factor BamB
MTPVAKDGFLYGIDGMKAATLGLVCLDLATGKKRWKVNPELAEEMDVNGERRLVPFGIDHASLVRAGDRFLCLGEQGHLLWLELSPDNPRILARTRLFAARETWGPLVVSHGLLYVRQNSKDPVSKKPTRLLCYDLRGE